MEIHRMNPRTFARYIFRKPRSGVVYPKIFRAKYPSLLVLPTNFQSAHPEFQAVASLWFGFARSVSSYTLLRGYTTNRAHNRAGEYHIASRMGRCAQWFLADREALFV